jgi:hypothetical protein
MIGLGKAIGKAAKKILEKKPRKEPEMLEVKPTVKGKPVGEGVEPTEIPGMVTGGPVFEPKGQKAFQVKKQMSRIR